MVKGVYKDRLKNYFTGFTLWNTEIIYHIFMYFYLWEIISKGKLDKLFHRVKLVVSPTMPMSKTSCLNEMNEAASAEQRAAEWMERKQRVRRGFREFQMNRIPPLKGDGFAAGETRGMFTRRVDG